MMSDSIRAAGPDDVPAMVGLSEQKRLEYQAYQPRFWRKADDSAAQQTAYFQRLLGEPNTICLIWEPKQSIEAA